MSSIYLVFNMKNGFLYKYQYQHCNYCNFKNLHIIFKFTN